MTTSSFFNNYNNRQEQGLVEDLINEAINIMGFTGYYIPNINEIARDLLFGDDPLKKFDVAYPVSLYLSNSVDPGMNNEFFSKFGLEIKNNVRVQLPRRDFSRRVPQSNYIRPREGDLIYISFLSGTGELYEIKFVNDSADFFTLGRRQPYYWELELELFKYNHEIIDTGIEEIDEVNKEDSYSVIYQLGSGSGDFIIKETVYQGANTATGVVQDWNIISKELKLTNLTGEFTANSYITGRTSNTSYLLSTFDEIDNPQIREAFDNKIIQTESTGIIDNSESNPFGSMF